MTTSNAWPDLQPIRLSLNSVGDLSSVQIRTPLDQLIDQSAKLIYTDPVMKTGIHPEVFETTVHCNGCNTTFTTHSTVKAITVEICSNCHPFYTGKQKLVDTAGRVDKFEARRKQA